MDLNCDASAESDNIQTLNLKEVVSDNEVSAGGNPFLPSHILKQLKQDNLGLVEEIAQSGEALTASTAMIRSHTRTTPSMFTPSTRVPKDNTKIDEKKINRYKTIDELMAKYMPVIEADLRRKLREVADEEVG